MSGRFTMEAIHIIRSLMEKYRERQKDLHLTFLDLEKAYDSVPRELTWKTLSDKGTPTRYLKVIQYMCEGARTYLTKGIQESVPWCLIFADDIVLVSETPQGLNGRLEQWRKALEDKGLRVSREKTEYMDATSIGTITTRTRKSALVFLAYRCLFVPICALCDLGAIICFLCRFVFSVMLFCPLFVYACYALLLLCFIGLFRPFPPFVPDCFAPFVPVVFLEAVHLSSGRGVTVYISPPSYLASARLGNVVVVVVELFGVESPSEESPCSLPLRALCCCLPFVPYAALS
ncbi:retrovirus-related pol polyprotein LINE-1 [Tanacetum coccineum]